MFSRSQTLAAALTTTAMAAALWGSLCNPVHSADGVNSVGIGALPADEIASRLKSAYPGLIKNVDGNDVVFTDDTRLPLDDGQSNKSFDDWLESPDIEDMFRIPYVTGDAKSPPAIDSDPGRARNSAFFAKIYGDCRNSNFAKSLVDVVWLPKKSGQKLKVSKTNGAADRLTAVSQELDALPASFDAYLFPSAGTYNCRVVAGTKNMSAHSYAIAIDIALKHAHYWRWAKGSKAGAIAYKNEIPLEIVRIFEKHGFIWGGKWYHYDTMHFEYRPELLPPQTPLVPQLVDPVSTP
jgi:D-alanyl-D-alanine carboxypeptidase